MKEIQNQKEIMVFLDIKSRGIKNKKILDAFLKIPRENFVPPEYKHLAYIDAALPTYQNQTISQPYIVALMTQLLNPQKNDNILEIGTGSGYQAAILSQFSNNITSIEIEPELCKFAKQNLEKSNIKNIKIICDNAITINLPKESFNKIIITAATKKIPQNIINALKPNGTIVLPEKLTEYNQILKKYKKINNKLQLKEESIPVLFVPLRKKK